MEKRMFENISMGDHATSEAVLVTGVKVYSVHSIWTGTPVGNLILEASNNGTDYEAIQTLAINAADSLMVNAYRPGYKLVRVRYDRISGSGTINSYLQAYFS